MPVPSHRHFHTGVHRCLALLRFAARRLCSSAYAPSPCRYRSPRSRSRLILHSRLSQWYMGPEKGCPFSSFPQNLPSQRLVFSWQSTHCRERYAICKSSFPFVCRLFTASGYTRRVFHRCRVCPACQYAERAPPLSSALLPTNSYGIILLLFNKKIKR